MPRRQPPPKHVIQSHISVYAIQETAAPLNQRKLSMSKMKATMNMRKTSTLAAALLAILMVCSLSGWGQSAEIQGTVKDGAVAMPGQSVQLWKDGNFTGRGYLTDDEGKFEFSRLEAGSYSIKLTVSGQTIVQNITVETDELQPMVIQIAVSNEGEDGPETRHKGLVIRDSKEIFTVDPKITWTMDRKEIEEFGGGRDIKALAALAPGMVQKDAGDPLNFKGGRSDANATYMDGMKLRGTDQMPLGAIEQITVVTGGLPAEYGDVMGAVIVVTTRNPGIHMGHIGKPLTKTEKQMQKQLRKKGSSEGALWLDLDGLACN
jgi:TonB-dependent Receptor Plug Domain